MRRRIGILATVFLLLGLVSLAVLFKSVFG